MFKDGACFTRDGILIFVMWTNWQMEICHGQVENHQFGFFIISRQVFGMVVSLIHFAWPNKLIGEFYTNF